SVLSSAIASAPSSALLARFTPPRTRQIIRFIPAALEVYNDFAEHLPAFDPRQALLEIRQSKLGIDDRRHAGGDLGQAVADIAHRRAERAKYLILLLEQLHQINGNGRARGRAASNQASAALEAEQRGIETFSANVLEHYV